MATTCLLCLRNDSELTFVSFSVLLLMISGEHFVFVIWFVGLLCLFCLGFGASASCLL